jgi:hypothetical protein
VQTSPFLFSKTGTVPSGNGRGFRETTAPGAWHGTMPETGCEDFSFSPAAPMGDRIGWQIAIKPMESLLEMCKSN